MRVTPSFALVLVISTVLSIANAAIAQDNIRWERGRAICESTFRWDAKPGGSIEVDVSAMDVKVTGGGENQIVMQEGIVLNVDNEEEAREYYEKYRIEVEQSGNDFRFRTPDDIRKPFRGGRLMFQVPETFNIEIATSGGDLAVKSIKGSVELATSGGDIDVSSITGNVELATSGGDLTIVDIDGELEAATSGGDVEVRHAGPDVVVHTSGGDLDLGGLKGSVEGVTSGGDIELRDSEGDITLVTSGGDIDIHGIKGGESVDVSTSGGSIYAEDIEADISLATSSGDIDLKNITGSVDAASSNGDIVILEVRGALIDVATSNGDVAIDQVQGELSIATSMGDVSARIKKSGESYAIELATSNGDVEIILPSNYKASVDAKIENWRKGKYGDIESAFPLDIRSQDSDTRVATGDINGGGPRVRLRTSHGDISIEKY